MHGDQFPALGKIHSCDTGASGPLLQKSGFIDDERTFIVSQTLDDIPPDVVANLVRITLQTGSRYS